MCFQIIGVIASIAGSIIQASAISAQAQAQADFQNYQIEVQNRQLQEEKDLAYIESVNTEITRREKARQMSANNAAITSGFLMGGTSRSVDALEAYNKEKLRTDVQLLRLNNQVINQRISDQIAVNNVSGMYARWNAKTTASAAWAGALFSSIGSIAKVGVTQNAYGYG